jgi:hypothetical protein
MVAEMNSSGVLTVMQHRSRTRPSSLLIGATRSSWSLSQEMGLPECSIGFAEQDEDSFDAGGNCLLKVA